MSIYNYIFMFSKFYNLFNKKVLIYIRKEGAKYSQTKGKGCYSDSISTFINQGEINEKPRWNTG